MNTEFYKSYIDDLRDTMTNGLKRGQAPQHKIFSNFSGGDTLHKSTNSYQLSQAQDKALFESLSPLNEASGKKVNYHLRPGAHPDFPITDESAHEYHYIVSAFIDVKRSTSLFKKYNPITVANIISKIQRVAVHTTWQHDGYIQRYHGDGLFAYFGGKNVPVQTAVAQALKANSFISHFMRNDLKNLFNEQGIENINTRIGIDTGEAEDTLWYKAGMGDCSEVTTCSIHTSLAAHMQSEANGNGIVVGDNIKKHASLDQDLYDYVRDDKGNVSYAFQIPEESYNYSQWHFKWERFIKTFSNVSFGPDGNMYSIDPAEAARIEQLKKQAALVNSGNAFTEKAGIITGSGNGVRNMGHRFHY